MEIVRASVARDLILVLPLGLQSIGDTLLIGLPGYGEVDSWTSDAIHEKKGSYFLVRKLSVFDDFRVY